MNNESKQNMFGEFLLRAGKVPGVKVDRSDFLRKVFEEKYGDPKKIGDIISKGPYAAGVPMEYVDKIADTEINLAVITATGISFISGIPGGATMLATIPADLFQFYAHTLIILQKMMYLYGWEENVFDKNGNMDSETKMAVILYLGLMFGISSVAKPLSTLMAKTTVNIINKSLLKGIWNKSFRNIALKVVKSIGLKTAFKGGWKYATKAVPVFGGIFSGTITLFTLLPMAKKLKHFLSKHTLKGLLINEEEEYTGDYEDESFAEKMFEDNE